MPMNLADQVILDPMFFDLFSRVRRAESIGTNGRSTTTNVTTARLAGVITMYSDRDLMRESLPELQYATNVISVVTNAQLQTAVTGYQPDLVVWRGDNYVVQKVSPYPQFGLGFYQAVCSSIDLMDVAL